VARLARLAIAGLPHHLIQRGHNRQAIFVDDIDRRAYIESMRTAARTSGVSIHAYVLLPDRVHLVATPKDEGALSQMMQGLGRRYVAIFNQRHDRVGTLWEGRFRCSVLEPARYLLTCMTQLEVKPVRQGLVQEAPRFEWSSAAHHYGLRDDPLIIEHPLFWALGNTPFEREAAYRTLVERALACEEDVTIEQATLKGWGLGSRSFLERYAQTAGRRLSPLPRGRPRKTVRPQ
jgi:putative transposase